MRCLFSTITLVAVLCSTACAPPSRVNQATYTRTPTGSDFLTRQEITSLVGAQNVYTVVQQLRPLFLTPRPGPAMARGVGPGIAVFIDGTLAGDLDVLKTLNPEHVESIRRIRQPYAYADYGRWSGDDGVVDVRLRWPARR